MIAWNHANIPDQSGRTALVTGANTGLGFEVARVLAKKRAAVILACRNGEKAKDAVRRILSEAPGARVSNMELDLADLNSVSRFVEHFKKTYTHLDLLINNAGVMVPPFARTAQGFELQLGTNHLGHFALTVRLIAVLRNTSNSRIVVVSSAGANFGRIDLTDLNFERRRYKKWEAYSQSKLANLLFMLELARRLRPSGAELKVTAAHPGGAATNLQRHTWFFRTFVNPMAMKAADGALPILRAACDPEIRNGAYFGPSSFFEMKGPPVEAYIPKRARDENTAARLWEISEKLTGVAFDLNPARKGGALD